MIDQEHFCDRVDTSVLAGIAWAYRSASSRLAEDFSEPAGYNATCAGVLLRALFEDRLDRVFSCGKYAVDLGQSGDSGLDFLFAELTPGEISTFPQISPGVVSRFNLNGSAGWRVEDVRWLLASARPGEVNTIEWARKSETKQLVARQLGKSKDNPSLFDSFGDDSVHEGLFVANGLPIDFDTLVVGYSLDLITLKQELVVGQSQWNPDGASAWYWTVDLLEDQTPGEAHGEFFAPSLVQPDEVPDAPVKLRRPAESEDDKKAGGLR
ncbi:hypothetical protein U6G28_06640 [Actinomycetaceae bacterium MB13-C1-2]|nr:hypothetical protein U6G28_06640 [Actinomycetaceae bacterium MB13-C1-2]